ncbi:MAG: SURF1 family protein [Microthrixaceae bacterium]
MPERYRFVLRPMWLATHVVVLAAVVVMVNLGFWQLDRLHEKQALADTLEARADEAPVPLDSLVEPGDGVDAVDDLRYRNASATGTYLIEDEVLVANRTLGGQPGYWVVTPLQVSEREAVPVVRGFVELVVGDEGVPVAAVAPPPGTVTVAGWVEGTSERGRFGGSDDRPGRIDRFNRLDLERLAEQVEVPLDPVALVAEDQQPPTDGDLLSAVARPEPDLGPHLGYAGQWFLFALVFGIGYPLMLRRQARIYAERALESDTPEPTDRPHRSSSEPVARV